MQLSVVVTVLGAVSTLLILYRIFKHPTLDIPGAHAGIKIGIWLGLIAAAALTYGGYLAMQDEGTSLGDVRDQASSAVSGAGSSSAAGPDSAPAAPAASATPAPESTPRVPPPAAPAPHVEEPGPAPPAPSAEPVEPAGPPIPPPAAPPEQP